MHYIFTYRRSESNGELNWITMYLDILKYRTNTAKYKWINLNRRNHQPVHWCMKYYIKLGKKKWDWKYPIFQIFTFYSAIPEHNGIVILEKYYIYYTINCHFLYGQYLLASIFSKLKFACISKIQWCSGT